MPQAKKLVDLENNKRWLYNLYFILGFRIEDQYAIEVQLDLWVLVKGRNV